MKVWEIIRLVEKEGWLLHRTRGSHRHFRHPCKPDIVTIAGHPAVDVPRGTLNSILKQAGLKIRVMRYTVVIEEGPTSFGAYVPDLPGCVAAAETRSEAVQLIREAIEFHLEEMRDSGMPILNPLSTTELIEVG